MLVGIVNNGLIDWDNLQIIEIIDEEGRLQVISEEQMFDILGTLLRVGFQLKFQHRIWTPTQMKMCSQQGKKKVIIFQFDKVLQLTNAYFSM
jgi:hypothetical protein